MPKHVLWIGDAQRRDQDLIFTGNEAKHAVRVKRLRVGERVLGLDGTGILVIGEVLSLGRELVIGIAETTTVDPLSPSIEVWAPMPKGSASGDLVDMLTQVGASSWVPMTTNRSVSPLSRAKRDRLGRVAIEACKQSRRAWLLGIGAESPFISALADDGAKLLIADQSGAPVEQIGADRVRLLVGPEGGFTEKETAQAVEAGATPCSFGPHIMRIEVAATVGCAALLGSHR